MRIKIVVCAALMFGLLAGGLVGCASERTKAPKLEAKAKITRAEAERIALAKVPGGTVKEGEIEKEKGRVIWSFDIATTGITDITEVAVDAMTGDVVSIQKETAGDEQKEKQAKKEKEEKEENK